MHRTMFNIASMLLMTACELNHSDFWLLPYCEESSMSVAWDDDSFGYSGEDLTYLLDLPLQLIVEWSDMTWSNDETIFNLGISADTATYPRIFTWVNDGEACNEIGFYEGWAGYSSGDFLRIPLSVEVTDSDGTITFLDTGTMDVNSLGNTFLGLTLRSHDLENNLGGTWMQGIADCQADGQREDWEITEVRLGFYGWPEYGMSQLSVVAQDPASGVRSVDVCWRGYWHG